jgi:spore coat polysaccharide biosynthesis protein SpsF
MRVLAIVQARRGSTRLPDKALKSIAGRPMLAHVLARAMAIPGIDQVVLATTVNSHDEELVDIARTAGVASVRGSVEKVLDRFLVALRTYPADAVVRIGGDCPLLDPLVSGRVVERFVRASGRFDYVSNVHPPTYPDGLDTEVMSAAALEAAGREAQLPSEREHVTPYIWERPERFPSDNERNEGDDLSALRWTVDGPRDLEFVRAMYEALSSDGTRIFGMAEVLDLLRIRPELSSVNAGTRRNEGFERSRRADLDWKVQRS